MTNSQDQSQHNGPGPEMEQTFDTLAKDIMNKYEANRGVDRRFMVAVAGGPGSGKTTIAEAVVKRINRSMGKDIAVTVPMDGYHYTKEELAKKGYDIRRRGAPWTIDAPCLCKDLETIREDTKHTVCLPAYSREKSDPVLGEIELYSNHQIILVEGLYLLLGYLWKDLDDPASPIRRLAKEEDGMEGWIADEISRWKPLVDLWDMTMYIEPPGGFEENRRRLVERFLKTWTPAKTELFGGGTALEAATRRAEMNDVRNARLVECCKDYATHFIQNI